MLEALIYQNHLNETINFGKDGIFVNESELHDYAWTVKSRNNKISGFKRGVTTKKLPVVIKCQSEQAGIDARNRMLSVMEKDILANEPGRIIIGDYYYKCFVTKSSKKSYLISGEYMLVDLVLSSDSPFWVREDFHAFRHGTGDPADGLDFPHDNPFDFTSGFYSHEVFNDSIASANFVLIVHGAATNPEVSVGGNIYKVNAEVDEGEYLTINSTTKEIYITANNGTKRNVFADRDKTNYIFEKIKPGLSFVSWVGEFDVDLILLDERSEPQWI